MSGTCERFLFSYIRIITCTHNKSRKKKRAHYFNSPDETQIIFVNVYATTGSLLTPEPLNQLARMVVRPRSVNVVNVPESGMFLAPITFLGLFLFLGKFAACRAERSTLCGSVSCEHQCFVLLRHCAHTVF